MVPDGLRATYSVGKSVVLTWNKNDLFDFGMCLSPAIQGATWLVQLLNISIQVLKRFKNILMHFENYVELGVNLCFLKSHRLCIVGHMGRT